VVAHTSRTTTADIRSHAPQLHALRFTLQFQPITPASSRNIPCAATKSCLAAAASVASAIRPAWIARRCVQIVVHSRHEALTVRHAVQRISPATASAWLAAAYRRLALLASLSSASCTPRRCGSDGSAGRPGWRRRCRLGAGRAPDQVAQAFAHLLPSWCTMATCIRSARKAHAGVLLRLRDLTLVSGKTRSAAAAWMSSFSPGNGSDMASTRCASPAGPAPTGYPSRLARFWLPAIAQSRAGRVCWGHPGCCHVDWRPAASHPAGYG